MYFTYLNMENSGCRNKILSLETKSEQFCCCRVHCLNFRSQSFYLTTSKIFNYKFSVCFDVNLKNVCCRIKILSLEKKIDIFFCSKIFLHLGNQSFDSKISKFLV